MTFLLTPYGRQTPRRPSMILVSWYSCHDVILSPQARTGLGTNQQNLTKVRDVTPWLGYIWLGLSSCYQTAPSLAGFEDTCCHVGMLPCWAGPCTKVLEVASSKGAARSRGPQWTELNEPNSAKNHTNDPAPVRFLCEISVPATDCRSWETLSRGPTEAMPRLLTTELSR